MVGVWARPERLTELYAAVSFVSIASLAIARPWLAQWIAQEKSAAPLLASPGRETWLDSARFVLMIFIVMGHYVAIPCSYIAEQSYWLAPLLVWINLFVMPGFAVLSGYLSKGPLTQPRIERLLIYVLFPYILSKVIYWFYSSVTYRMIGWFDLFDAFSNSLGLEWYLIVLVQWRLAIALMSPLNRTALLCCSLAIGLVSGNWVPGNAALALQRACAFFPFFVLGYSLDLAALRDAVTRNRYCNTVLRFIYVAALGLLFYSPGIANLFMINTLGDLNFDYAGAVPTNVTIAKVAPWNIMPVVGPLPRDHSGIEWHLSFVHRLVRYELGAVLLLGLLAWVPSSSTMAWYGRHTMYPYLLHPWIFQLWLMPLINRHLVGFISTLGAISLGGWIWALSAILATPLTMALSCAPVRWATGVFIEPLWMGKLLLASSNEQLSKDNLAATRTKDDGWFPMPIAKASV